MPQIRETSARSEALLQIIQALDSVSPHLVLALDLLWDAEFADLEDRLRRDMANLASDRDQARAFLRAAEDRAEAAEENLRRALGLAEYSSQQSSRLASDLATLRVEVDAGSALVDQYEVNLAKAWGEIDRLTRLLDLRNEEAQLACDVPGLGLHISGESLVSVESPGSAHTMRVAVVEELVKPKAPALKMRAGAAVVPPAKLPEISPAGQLSSTSPGRSVGDLTPQEIVQALIMIADDKASLAVLDLRISLGALEELGKAQEERIADYRATTSPGQRQQMTAVWLQELLRAKGQLR